MSKIQWEYDLVEKPFCEQLKAMGSQWIEGDIDAAIPGQIRCKLLKILNFALKIAQKLSPKTRL